MAHDAKKLSLIEVTAIGIGGMIGGGIFAVLGLAIAVAGHAVALTLAGGGVIALLTGLSYAHLGLAFRDDGGSFTYMEKAFAAPGVAGIAGWLLVAGYVGTLALYATAFGDYGATLIGGTGPRRAAIGACRRWCWARSWASIWSARSCPAGSSWAWWQSSWASWRCSPRWACWGCMQTISCPCSTVASLRPWLRWR